MVERLVVPSESPTEYFRELVESAMHHQHLDAHELTSFYVVNLLTGFVHLDHAPGADDQPLGVKLVKAMQAAGIAQRDALRQVGDVSLFVSGFFADSLSRGLVDVDYYIQLGERAYGSLAQRTGRDNSSDVFEELSAKFAGFVDVLSEVSERTSLTSNADLLRLYEKWQRTGSRRSADLLTARGIVPNAVTSRFVQ